MSTGTYSLVKTVAAGDVITASDRNAEHQNHINYANPDGIGAHSDNATEMQAVRDPYPGGVASLAADIGEELESLRYVLKQLSGVAQWYIDPPFSLSDTRFIVKNYERAMDAASGTQSLTGVGFTPKAAIFIASVNETPRGSWGLDDGTTHLAHTMNHLGVAGNFGYTNTASIFVTEASGKSQAGYISAWTTDGGTLTWARTGATAAGTCNFIGAFFR